MQEGTSQSWQDEQALSSGVAILPEEVEELQKIPTRPRLFAKPHDTAVS